MKRISAIILASLMCLVVSARANGPVDASKYGFRPGAPASANVRALQKALDGGHKTVTIYEPGVYDLDATVYLDDETELVCGRGVLLRKAADYSNMFVNRGALTREYNTGIVLRGLRLSVNGHDVIPTEDSPLFGLRAQLSFLCASYVQVYDFECFDLGKMQYGIQFNQADHYILDTFVIKGDKDGVHISSSDSFVIRNGIMRTFDDALALNASDWNSSNCVDGDITNGLIENITDEALEPHSGILCRLLVGAWVDWYEGISIRRGDMVVCDGRMYKAIAPVSDTEYFSKTRPSITSFEGRQKDEGGFGWKLVRNDMVYYSTNIRNITLRRINAFCARSGFSQETYYSDSKWARTFHPDVSGHYDKYPHIEDVTIDDCYLPGLAWLFWNQGKVHSFMTFRNMRGFKTQLRFNAPESPEVRSDFNVFGCDFTHVSDSVDLNVAKGVNLRVLGCVCNGALRVMGDGDFQTDSPVVRE